MIYEVKIKSMDWTNIVDFNRLKKLVPILNKYALGKLFMAAVKKGIPRDVEYMLPFVKNNGLQKIIDESLCIAAQNCHVAVMDLLIRNNANISYDNNIALRKAVIEGHEDAVRFLLYYGGDVHTNNDELLLDCCRSGDNSQVLALLIDHGIDVFKNYHQAFDICLNLGHNNCISALVRHSDYFPKKEPKLDPDFENYVDFIIDYDEYHRVCEENENDTDSTDLNEDT